MLNIKQKLNRKSLKKFFKNFYYTVVDFKMIFFHIFKKTINDKDFIILTGANSDYFDKLVNLLNSINLYEKNIITKIYNLGLSQNQINFLKNNFPENFVIVEFEFHNYPEFVSKVDSSNKLGSYAWKPIIIFNEYKNSKNLIWLDAGCVVTKNLKLLKKLILKYGYFSPLSSDKVKNWTHPNTIQKLNFPNKYLNRRNFQAGTLGFSVENEEVNNLINLWYKHSLDKNVIAPDGSSRFNHRQDQAVLTLLIYLCKLENSTLRTLKMFGIKIHEKNVKLNNIL